MWNTRMNTSIALVFVLSLFGTVAEGNDAEILPVNSPADLDLSGNIVYAINFGNNGSPNVDGVAFLQDQDYPGVTLGKTGEDLATIQGGAYPDTGDPDLDKLLAGVAWQNSGGNVTTSVNASGLVIGTPYQLQLIFYTDHSRYMDIIVEGSIVARYDPFRAQGSTDGMGGSMVKYDFTAGDNTLNVDMKSISSNASVISGLILTEKPSVSFADYGSGTTTQLFAGGAVWQLNWGQGPWTWSDSTEDQPLLDTNVSAVLDLRTTAAADVSADLVATLPIGGTLILTANDEDYKDVSIGTMVLSGAGINVIDINASRVIVDEGSGMFLAPFHPPGPKVTLTLEEATGVFAYINQAGTWELSLAGSYAIPLIEGLELQDNIMTALGGNVALIGGIGEFALTGQYVPDMSKMVKSFCEYGTAVSLQLGAGGALWDQTWGKGPYEWFQCDADPDSGILNENIAGMLETTTAGPPQVDENLILSFDFGGNFALTDYNDVNPDEIAGEILGDVKGTFVADMNAANAVVDEAAGTIVIAFGAELHDDPDALITITETKGTFASIQAVGLWKWHVIGTITCARVPDLSVQDNIMAALGNNDLLLGADEEIVLSGSYYRSSP
ncbi:MAG: hypothetical protein H8D56_16930 [Planctomycetes bacterium]|nr:hypothetical protein [Planctomycetota bacterium]MBL7146830.1 hypothetical protein [Phycisphaerae bacterium]